MDRFAARLIIVVVVIGAIIGFKFMRKANAGEDYRKAAHEIVAQADGYAQHQDYYDWLVDTGHDECFSNAYHMDFSRRHDNSWVDDDKYMEDLFTWMIQHANDDKSTQVADSLAHLRSKLYAAAEAEMKSEVEAAKAAAKATGKKPARPPR